MNLEWSDDALADLDRFVEFLNKERPSLAAHDESMNRSSAWCGHSAENAWCYGSRWDAGTWRWSLSHLFEIASRLKNL
jgi:hypothetical protein